MMYQQPRQFPQYHVQPQQAPYQISPNVQEKLNKVQTLFPQANQQQMARMLQKNIGKQEYYQRQQCEQLRAQIPQQQMQYVQQAPPFQPQIPQESNQYQNQGIKIESTIVPNEINAPIHFSIPPSCKNSQNQQIQSNQSDSNIYMPQQFEMILKPPQMPLEAPRLPYLE